MKNYMETKNVLNGIGKVLLMVWAIYTFMSPVDLIPDMAIGIGQIDDVIAVLIAVKECYSTIYPLITKNTH